jgi:hypothetical protein
MAKRRTVDEDSGGDRRAPDVEGINERSAATGHSADKGDRSAGRTAGRRKPRPAGPDSAPVDADPDTAGDT